MKKEQKGKNRKILLVFVVVFLALGLFWLFIFYLNGKGEKLIETADNSDALQFNKSDSSVLISVEGIHEMGAEVKGILIDKYSDTNFNKKGKIEVKIGRYILFGDPRFFNEPANVLAKLYKGCIHSQYLVIVIKDKRMFVSAEFRDLNSGKITGILEYNHWKFFDSTSLKFISYDSRFEVKDIRNNIVFSIKYFNEKPSADVALLEISGYLIDANSILLMGCQMDFADYYDSSKYNYIQNECFLKTQKQWKLDAQKEISKIKSVF